MPAPPPRVGSQEMAAKMGDVMWVADHIALIKTVEGNRLYIDNAVGAFSNLKLSGTSSIGQRFDVYKFIWGVKDSSGRPLNYRSAVKVGSVSISEEQPGVSIGTYTGQPITKRALTENNSCEYEVFVP